MMEWQPIETAPKDGTKIIGLMKDGLVGTITSQRYHTWKKDEDGTPLFVRYWTWDKQDQLMPVHFDVTHWMPLPEPPKDE